VTTELIHGQNIRMILRRQSSCFFFKAAQTLPIRFEKRWRHLGYHIARKPWVPGPVDLWFAKTLADFEINDIAGLPPLFCYNS